MMTRHVSPAVAALCLVLGACSASDQTEAAASSDESADPVAQALAGEGDEAPDQLAAAATTTVPGTPQVYEPGIDDVAVALLGPEALSATTTEPPRPPVTTIRGGGGDSVAIYRGVMGSLEPDEVVVPAVVDPPVAEPGTLPLTGELGAAPERPAAVVKIDNSPGARPQTGLNQADIVVEEEVEGGLTRFAAVFHSRQTTMVGPVRSGRTTDIGVLGSLGSPVLVYSGANRVTDTLIRRQDYVQNHSFDTTSGYWRGRGRAPSNLFTDLEAHWASAKGTAPPAHFAFRGPDAVVPGIEASSVTVAFRANRVVWTWDGSAWLRSQGGEPHTVFSGEQVAAANVIVIEANEVATGMVDANGAGVPEFVTVGSGPVTVFTAGHQINGTWTRPTLASVTTLTTIDGAVIELTPGRTWIEIVEEGAGMFSADN